MKTSLLWCTVCALTCLASTVGCGAEQKQPQVSETEDMEEERPDDTSGIQMSAEIGGLNQSAVDTAFSKCLKDLERCLGEGSERMEFLGGDVEFLIKIGSDGHLVEAMLEQSTLGDWDTERCMLGALKDRTWPRPVGGEVGIARKSFSFDMPNDVRPPTDWDSESIKTTLEEIDSDLRSCKARGAYRVTMYVDTSGHPMSVGVAHSEDNGDASAGCLVQALKSATYPSPGSWPAKVSFGL